MDAKMRWKTRQGTFSSAKAVPVAWQEDGPPPNTTDRCGFFWLSGFRSDMVGTKAEALATYARDTDRPCLRFDYSGHGESGGDFARGTISVWLAEAAQAFRSLAHGPRIVIGSSMGGWLALLLLRQLRNQDRDAAERIRGVVLIAPAADMTKDLMWDRWSEEIRRAMISTGAHREPSRYGGEPYLYTHELIEDGRGHLLLAEGLEIHCPLRILQGDEDPDVPASHALKTFHALRGADIQLILVKGGDHRLSQPRDLRLLLATVEDLARQADEVRSPSSADSPSR